LNKLLKEKAGSYSIMEKRLARYREKDCYEAV
jgi:hypothetical protein